MRTFRRHPVRRGLHDFGRSRHGDASLLAPRLGLDHLAGQGVADEPHSPVLPGDAGAAMRDGRRLEDHRRQSAVGSFAGLKPADSTICAATSKPAPTLSGWWASLPKLIAW